MSMDAEQHKMGTRIKAWRKENGYKGYEFAKVIKISQGSLSDIENNKSLPSAVTLRNLRAFTPIDIIWVLTGGYAKQGEERTSVSNVCPKCHKVERVLDLIKDALRK